ncbi:hypothetical protein [Bdellovibrio sp. HCB-162]|uniref:hypothetical protein n=1 Tax=Bdellovibrio sp. HCB-162 TaxID=3394234 RepID=UPI0039BC4C69
MKKWVRLALFLLAFQMEVRVRASGEVMQQPSACLKSKETCAIQVTGSGFHLLQDSLKIHASEGATLVRLSNTQWRFVKGALWIEKGANVEVETLYGSLKASQGQYWVVEQGDQVLIRNVDATLTVTLRDGKSLEVPEGFEFWISGMNSKGVSSYGMIQPIDMKNHLPLWNSLYRGSKEDFVKEVTHLRANWGDLTEKSSLIYKTVVQREIASELAKQKIVEKKKQRLEAERRQVKELYRQRVFER